jgi:hypothetical protein
VNYQQVLQVKHNFHVPTPCHSDTKYSLLRVILDKLCTAFSSDSVTAFPPTRISSLHPFPFLADCLLHSLSLSPFGWLLFSRFLNGLTARLSFSVLHLYCLPSESSDALSDVWCPLLLSEYGCQYFHCVKTPWL